MRGGGGRDAAAAHRQRPRRTSARVCTRAGVAAATAGSVRSGNGRPAGGGVLVASVVLPRRACCRRRHPLCAAKKGAQLEKSGHPVEIVLMYMVLPRQVSAGSRLTTEIYENNLCGGISRTGSNRRADEPERRHPATIATGLTSGGSCPPSADHPTRRQWPRCPSTPQTGAAGWSPPRPTVITATRVEPVPLWQPTSTTAAIVRAAATLPPLRPGVAGDTHRNHWA